MSEVRDGVEVHAEQVTAAAAAVAAATQAADAQQQQAGQWLDSGVAAEGKVVTSDPHVALLG